MNKQTIGLFVEIGGALGVVGGAVAGFHHLLFSVPVGIGVLAIYVGRKLRAGSI